MKPLLQGVALLVVLLTPVMGCLVALGAGLRLLEQLDAMWLGGPMLVFFFATMTFCIWLVIDSRDGAGRFVGVKLSAAQYGRFAKGFGTIWLACAALAVLVYAASLT